MSMNLGPQPFRWNQWRQYLATEIIHLVLGLLPPGTVGRGQLALAQLKILDGMNRLQPPEKVPDADN